MSAKRKIVGLGVRMERRETVPMKRCIMTTVYRRRSQKWRKRKEAKWRTNKCNLAPGLCISDTSPGPFGATFTIVKVMGDEVKRRIVNSVFNKQGSSGAAGEQYVAHCKIYEDAGPGPARGVDDIGRKARYIILSCTHIRLDRIS